MSSPFSRRPTLSKTYSRRTSNGNPPPTSTATRYPSTTTKSILLDSDSDEDSDGGQQPVKRKDKGNAGEKDKAADKGKAAAKRKVDQDKQVQTKTKTYGKASTSTDAPAPRPAPARRTRSSTVVAPPAETKEGGAASKQGSTLWDEEAALAVKPSRPTRGRASTSTAAADTPSSLDSSSRPSRPKRTSSAAANPPSLAEPKRVKASGNGSGKAQSKTKGRGKNEEEEEDDIPPPTDYVPLSERISKLSPPKRERADAPKPILPPPAPPPQPAAVPTIFTAPPTTSPPRSEGLSPAPAPPAKAPSVPPAPPPRPASPAKDLSAIFSRFSSSAVPSTSTAAPPSTSSASVTAIDDGEPQTLAVPVPRRMGLKRSASSTVDGVVGRMKPGRKLTAEGGRRTPSVGVGEDGSGGEEGGFLDLGRKSPFLSTSTAPHPHPLLDRSLSQPHLSSPLSSPNRGASRSPSRPSLGSSMSYPAFAPSHRAQSPSPLTSPTRPSPQRRATVFPSYGSTAGGGPETTSAYRPLAFAPPPSALISAAAGGTNGAGAAGGVGGAPAGGVGGRTYGGPRTFRRDIAEEALYRGAETGSTSSSTLPSALSPASTNPLLPPSLRRALLPPPTAAVPRETYASLRTRWGIDAEESLENASGALPPSPSGGGGEAEVGGETQASARVEGLGVLRKRGEGKRWNDEVGFLLEGLRGGGEGEGREGGEERMVGGDGEKASAIDLLRKLLDREWLRRLKASGMAEQLYRAFRRAGAGEGTDRVLDTALSLLLALLLRDQRLSEPLFRLSPSDITPPRPSSASSSFPSSPAPSSPALSRHTSYNSHAQSQSQSQPEAPSSSFPSFSSSPRKRSSEQQAAAAADERCDFMEVLKVFLTPEESGDGSVWLREEIGAGREERERREREAEREEKGKGAKVKGRKAVRRERGEGRHLQALRDIIDDSELFLSDPDLPVTHLSILLLATRSLASYTPRAIFQPQHLLCVSGAFGEVVKQGVVEECRGARGRVEGYEKGMDLLPFPSASSTSSTSSVSPAPSLATLLLSLSTLELISSFTPLALPSISVSSLLPSLAASLRDLALLACLIAVDCKPSTVAAGHEKEGEEEREKEKGRTALVAVLGVLYGLSTEVGWCGALLDPAGAATAARRAEEEGDLESADEHDDGLEGLAEDGEKGEIVTTLVRTVVAARRRAREVGALVESSSSAAAAAASAASAKATSPLPSVIAKDAEDDVEMLSIEGEERGGGGGADEPLVKEQQQLWDILSLSLGVLANVFDSLGDHEDVKDLIRKIRLNPSCRGRRKCARSCICAEEDEKPALEILAGLAKDSMDDAPNSIYQTSTTGFLRLLLGFSMLSSPSNEAFVLSVLLPTPLSPSSTSATATPPPTTNTTPLVAILDALDDLAKIQDQQRAARRGLLLLPAGGGEGANGEGGAEEQVAETQVDEELEGVMRREEEERVEETRGVRELVRRLRGRVEEVGA